MRTFAKVANFKKMNEITQEIVPIAKDDLFIILNHPNAKFDYPVHTHPEYEINLVMDCSGTRIVGDSEEEFSGTDLVMTGHSVPHAWKSDDAHNHVITIQFSADIASYPLFSKRMFAPIRNLLEDSSQGLCFDGREQTEIKREIIALTSMQGFQSFSTFFGILNLMAMSDRRKLVSRGYSAGMLSEARSRRITKVCEWAENNLEHPLRLGEAAALVNMSESAFSHFFKKRTGISWIRHVNNLRIAKACDLLAGTTLSAAEICYDCGFNNQSNFIRNFAKVKHMTPIEYRRHIAQLLIKY